MSYYTFSNKHALENEKAEFLRLKNIRFGLETVKNSSIYSDEIKEIKKHGIIKSTIFLIGSSF